jgi:DNA-binding CsgD family transcriptional regulator
MGSVGVLLERAPELEAVQRALGQAVNGRGALVVFRGAAGLGKSTLLSVGADAARTSGRVVLSARASSLESHIPFGLARKLIAPLLRDPTARERLLAGDGALVSPLFSADWTRWGGDDVAIGVQEGLCAIVAAATVPAIDAESAALTLVLDDLQWADRPTLRFLIALLGRLDDIPVTVFCAHRAERDGESADLLDILEDDPATVVRALLPLSEAGALQLVRETLGDRADPDLAEACVRATGGNPFYLGELLRELREAGPEMPSAAAVASTVPASVTRSVAVRLARLPEQATALARALAILGDDAELAVVGRLAGLSSAEADAASDALVGAAIIEPTEPLCFIHSLVGSAIYDDLTPFARVQLHRRAADMLMDAGAAAERVAAQLLVARPQGDQRAVAVLQEAASFARARGEPAVAVTLLERALAEDPPPASRAEILLDLAGADIRVGSSGAGARLEEALALLDDPAQQARTLRAHSAVLHHAGDFEGAAQACRRGLDLVSPDHPLADQLQAGFIGAGLLSPSMLVDARAELRRLLDDDSDLSRSHVPALCAQLAIYAAEHGAPDHRVQLIAERAFAEDPLVDGDSMGMSLGYAAQALIWVDALETAGSLVDAAADAARRQGAFLALAVARLNQATVAYHRGRLDDAVAYADQALEVRRYGWTDSTWSTPVLALAHLERGDLDAARDAIALGERANSARSDHAMLLEARARLALVSGDPASALTDARAAGALVEGDFQSRCSRLFRWRVIAAHAAHLLGHDDEARALVEDALGEARTLGTPRHLGESLTVAGLIEGDAGGLALHEEAVGVLERSPSRLRLAHALVELGASRRRQGQRTAAADPLSRGLELADELGAAPLVARARHELGLLGARPRRSARTGPSSLTPGERAVAELAAEGLTNAQIAQRLFIARKTVESHLASAYRKLAIKTRAELPMVLGFKPPSADPPG